MYKFFTKLRIEVDIEVEHTPHKRVAFESLKRIADNNKSESIEEQFYFNHARKVMSALVGLEPINSEVLTAAAIVDKETPGFPIINALAEMGFECPSKEHMAFLHLLDRPAATSLMMVKCQTSGRQINNHPKVTLSSAPFDKEAPQKSFKLYNSLIKKEELLYLQPSAAP
ncbi:MAG: hypothetical protein ACHP65_02795 [Legionellales bacterium]